MSGGALLLAVALLLLNAFFVGAEFAVISARRSQIEPLAAEGRRSARTTLWALEHLSLMLACAQLGITVASLGLGAVAEPAVAHLLEMPFAAAAAAEEFVHPAAFVIALALVVYLHVCSARWCRRTSPSPGPSARRSCWRPCWSPSRVWSARSSWSWTPPPGCCCGCCGWSRRRNWRPRSRPRRCTRSSPSRAARACSTRRSTDC